MTLMSFLLINLTFFIFLFLLYPLSFKIKLLDFPNNRKIHNVPIPTIGGILIYLTFFTLSFLFVYEPYLNFILYSCSIIILIGLLDDLYEISAFIRLLFQILVCIFIIQNGIYIVNLGEYNFLNFFTFQIYNLKILGFVLTIFSITCIVNAFNFIDGLDGLASSSIIISSLSLLTFTFFYTDFIFDKHLFLFIFLYLNFLFFILNKNFLIKFKIFYGDSGSTFIGFLFGWILIYYAHPTNNLIHPVMAIWCITLPMYDFLRIIIFRISNGLNAFSPDNNHIHHILLNYTKSHHYTFISLLVISLFLNFSGLASYYIFGSGISLILFIVLFIFYLKFISFLKISKS